MNAIVRVGRLPSQAATSGPHPSMYAFCALFRWCSLHSCSSTDGSRRHVDMVEMSGSLLCNRVTARRPQLFGRRFQYLDLFSCQLACDAPSQLNVCAKSYLAVVLVSRCAIEEAQTRASSSSVGRQQRSPKWPHEGDAGTLVRDRQQLGLVPIYLRPRPLLPSSSTGSHVAAQERSSWGQSTAAVWDGCST